MATQTRLPAGSIEWLTMVGETLQAAAQRAGLSSDLTLSLVERYSDGAEIAPGLVQGLRFDIRRGLASYRVGVSREEEGDITIEVTRAAARRLNQLLSTDPAYADALNECRNSGALSMRGSPEKLGSWFESVHDAIVRRTEMPAMT